MGAGAENMHNLLDSSHDVTYYSSSSLPVPASSNILNASRRVPSGSVPVWGAVFDKHTCMHTYISRDTANRPDVTGTMVSTHKLTQELFNNLHKQSVEITYTKYMKTL